MTHQAPWEPMIYIHTYIHTYIHIYIYRQIMKNHNQTDNFQKSTFGQPDSPTSTPQPSIGHSGTPILPNCPSSFTPTISMSGCPKDSSSHLNFPGNDSTPQQTQLLTSSTHNINSHSSIIGKKQSSSLTPNIQTSSRSTTKPLEDIKPFIIGHPQPFPNKIGPCAFVHQSPANNVTISKQACKLTSNQNSASTSQSSIPSPNCEVNRSSIIAECGQFSLNNNAQAKNVVSKTPIPISNNIFKRAVGHQAKNPNPNTPSASNIFSLQNNGQGKLISQPSSHLNDIPLSSEGQKNKNKIMTQCYKSHQQQPLQKNTSKEISTSSSINNLVDPKRLKDNCSSIFTNASPQQGQNRVSQRMNINLFSSSNTSNPSNREAHQHKDNCSNIFCRSNCSSAHNPSSAPQDDVKKTLNELVKWTQKHIHHIYDCSRNGQQAIFLQISKLKDEIKILRSSQQSQKNNQEKTSKLIDQQTSTASAYAPNLTLSHNFSLHFVFATGNLIHIPKNTEAPPKIDEPQYRPNKNKYQTKAKYTRNKWKSNKQPNWRVAQPKTKIKYVQKDISSGQKLQNLLKNAEINDTEYVSVSPKGLNQQKQRQSLNNLPANNNNNKNDYDSNPCNNNLQADEITPSKETAQQHPNSPTAKNPNQGIVQQSIEYFQIDKQSQISKQQQKMFPRKLEPIHSQPHTEQVRPAQEHQQKNEITEKQVANPEPEKKKKKKKNKKKNNEVQPKPASTPLLYFPDWEPMFLGGGSSCKCCNKNSRRDEPESARMYALPVGGDKIL